MATKETIAKSPSGRVKRVPVSTRNVLTVKGKDPEYVYRIVNDQADRIAQFQEAGYEIVQSGEGISIGDKRVNNATPEGSVVQISVGKGDRAFLMKQRKEFYDEDQAAKAQRVDALEQSMKQEAVQQGGRFEVDRSTKF